MINTQTAFVTTLSVSPKFLKCNTSITNCPIAVKFDKEVNKASEGTYTNINTQTAFGTYGQIRAITGMTNKVN